MWKHTSHEPILKTANRRPTDSTTDFVFSAVAALEWLNDLTTIVGRDEAAEVAAHFVRCGFIALVPDRTMKVIDPSKVTVVRGAGVVKGQAAPIVGHSFGTSKGNITDVGACNSRSRPNSDSGINASTRSRRRGCVLLDGKPTKRQIDPLLVHLRYPH